MVATGAAGMHGGEDLELGAKRRGKKNLGIGIYGEIGVTSNPSTSPSPFQLT